jgi:CxxC motif-containing protein (DUF1111 family)
MKWMLTAVLVAMCACLAIAQQGVVDPGPRGAPISAGQLLPGVTPAQAADQIARFTETETFPGGLGPRYNSGPFGACSECHAQPAVGGSSPSLTAFPFIGPNPQIADATADGATNEIPSFITATGPVREARFVSFPNGTADGGVHDLYTVTGRTDAPTCQLSQPNFAANLAAGNVIFRIPLQLFGDGLIENIDDATILANQAANRLEKALLGISGFPNRNGNTQTIARFGWKGQNASLLLFAGEAYLNEDGITNELFGIKRPSPGETLPASCKITSTPDDTSNPTLAGVAVLSDIEEFAAFMRDLAPPTPAPSTPQTIAGQAVFNQIGCALCHTPSMTTAKSSELPALSQVQANLFSDLLVHHLGTGLADGITQGSAGPDEFRTAPLWGVGQRVFFLHDGRCTTLPCAIQAHASNGSEANGVIGLFNRLPLQSQQNLILFLRSL